MKLRLPKPLSHQTPILSSLARFKVAACGRRFGKSVAGSISAVLGHGPVDANGIPKFPGAMYGKNIAWITSTNKNAKRVIWPLLKEITKPIWTADPSAKNEVDKTISFPGGGTVVVWSAEAPDTIRGEGLDGAVCDEFAFATQYLWFKVIRPALMDNKGWAFLITTPNGKNWFYQLFERAKGLDSWEVWQLPSHANPALDPKELEGIEKECLAMGESVDQEIYARFTSGKGAIWPSSYFDDIFVDKWPPQIKACVSAHDPASGKKTKGHDYPAFVMVGTQDGSMYYADAFMQKHSFEELRPKLIDFIKSPERPQPAIISIEVDSKQYMDHPTDFRNFSGAKIFNDQLAHAGLMTRCAIHTSTVNKTIRIKQLGEILSTGRLKFIKGEGSEIVVSQLQQFGMEKVHDDGPDCLEMAFKVLKQLVRNIS